MKTKNPWTLFTSLSAMLVIGSDLFEFDFLEILTSPACLALSVAAALLSSAPAVRADGSIAVIVTNGTPVPEGNGWLDNTNTGNNPPYPVINDSGQVAFQSAVGLSNSVSKSGGIYRFDPATGQLTNIVREGQSAPDGNGIFSGLSGPAILNNAGQVAFESGLANTIGGTNNAGLFRGSGGVITQFVRTGWTCPDGNGRYNTLPGQPAFNTSGQVAFASGLTGSTNIYQTAGIFLGNGTALTQIARIQYAPGPFGVFGSFGTPALNDSGQVAFGIGGAQATTGVYRVTGTTMTKIAYQYESAPDGNGYLNWQFSDVALNNAGQLGFVDNLNGTIGGSNWVGIFRGDGNTLAQIVRTDWPVPDGNGFFNHDGACNTCPSPWFMNNAGQIVFTSGIGGTGATTNDSGIYRGDGATLKKIAREGEPAPDSNAKFGTLIPHEDSNLRVTMNDLGQVVFFASLSDGGRGIYFYDDHLGLIKVIRTGEVLAGGTVNALRLVTSWTLGSQGRGLNNRGQIAFGVNFVPLGANPSIAVWGAPELRITDIRTVANDVRLTWNTIAGKTNVVQVTPGASDGSYTNNFTDLSSNIVVSGVGQVSTNWLDVGGATNSPARYYRVRLVP